VTPSEWKALARAMALAVLPEGYPMGIDLTDMSTFVLWREQFTNALDGVAISTDESNALVTRADALAQSAVELIQKRRADVKVEVKAPSPRPGSGVDR
jgi:hypothetical protein